MTPRYNVLALRVECEHCGAKIAQECIGARGVPIRGTHHVRRQRAAALREQIAQAKAKAKGGMSASAATRVSYAGGKMLIHKDSHVDHGITQAQLDYIGERSFRRKMRCDL